MAFSSFELKVWLYRYMLPFLSPQTDNKESCKPIVYNSFGRLRVSKKSIVRKTNQQLTWVFIFCLYASYGSEGIMLTPLCKLLYLIWRIIALRLCWKGFVRGQKTSNQIGKICRTYEIFTAELSILFRSTESKIYVHFWCTDIGPLTCNINMFCICFSPSFFYR